MYIKSPVAPKYILVKHWEIQSSTKEKIIRQSQYNNKAHHRNMSGAFDLARPNRPIRAGVILMGAYVLCQTWRRPAFTEHHCSETEILDVAPIDLLYGMSKHFVKPFEDDILTPELKAQALDFEFHWVNQFGKASSLTGGLPIQPTVR